MLPNCVLGTPLIRQRLPPNAPEVLWEELWPDRYWETPQGLRMLLGAFRGGNPLERIVWFWEVCRPDLVTPVTRRSRKPLGRVVGVPSLWPRPGGVLQQHGLGVLRQVGSPSPDAGRPRGSYFPHAVYKDEGVVKDKSVLCSVTSHRVFAQSWS
jgi:hypothetical protein